MIDQRTFSIGTIALRVLALAILIGLCSCFSIAWTRPAGEVAIVWVASGLLTGLLLTSNRQLWPAYIAAALLGNLIARVAYGDPLIDVASRGIASTLDACIVAYAVRFLVEDITDLRKLPLVMRMAAGSTLVACAISALLVATLSAYRGAAFQSMFVAWFISHTLGLIIVTTLVVVVRQQGRLLIGRTGRRWKFARSIGLLAATTLWVFSQSRFPLLFMVYPPLLLAVFRHRFRGVAVGISVITLISVICTLHGSGPFFIVKDASFEQRILLLQLFIAVACLLALPVATVLAERGRLTAQLRDSEQGYRLLADYSRDLVVRMRADGRRLYVSPSVKDVLGWEPSELMDPRWDLVHPDDRSMLVDALQKLLLTGNAMTVVYRALHRNGNFVWIEALARRVPGSEAGDPAEIIYAGRDISKRIAVEQSLAESERRTRTITDNLPAMVAYIDAEQRYTFLNAFSIRAFGHEADFMIGRTMLEVRGEKIYATMREHVATVLNGEFVAFESEREVGGTSYHFLTKFIPDIANDGTVRGFYAMGFDVSDLKRAQQELLMISQHDSLTGLGNRNKFNERLNIALAKAGRSAYPIALIYLDIDHFKQINDTLGHTIGDAVLSAFAQRLQENVRTTDLAVRLGGDEFAVIIEDIESSEAAEAIVRKLITAMQPGFVVQAHELQVTASIGVCYCHMLPSIDTLMQTADTALYEAKAAGRNTYRIVAVD